MLRAMTGRDAPDQPYRVLDDAGNASLDPSELGLKEEDLRELYRLLVLSRRADLEATALQRQGQLAVYPPLIGQEAAQVGSAYALAEEDFIFPSYREMASALVRGVDLVEYLLFHRATWHGGLYDPNAHRFGMVSVPVGSQTLHAVGYAMGARLDGRPICTLMYFGDGATSEGDFHEACNFAGVWKAGVVFVCQNNQYAISVPLTRQTAAPTIAAKAIGYGFPGVRVDGNDVLAVYQAAREAVRRARDGEGPTLIECVTFRMGPHSTADDPTRYRTEEEMEKWRRLDPLARFEAYLKARDALPEDFVEQVHAQGDERARELRDEIVGAGPPPAETMFDWVYHERIPVLDFQREFFLREQQLREGD